MNAIEFVKKYGKAVAVNLHNKSQGCKLSEVLFYDSKNDKYECLDSEDLKQIVDAFELVESYGGLAEARWDLDNPKIDASEAHDLKKAINLVEQCNA